MWLAGITRNAAGNTLSSIATFSGIPAPPSGIKRAVLLLFTLLKLGLITIQRTLAITKYSITNTIR